MEHDLLEDLDAYVGSLEPEPERPTMDDDLANRMLRRIRRQEITRDEVAAVAKAERDRIDAWERDRLERIDTDVAGIERLLDGYMRAVEQRRNLRTLKLPNGELRLRAARDRIAVEDDDAFLAWAVDRAARAVGADPAAVAEHLAAVRAEPLLRLKLEPAKNEIARAGAAGPQRSIGEDLELLAAVVFAADEAGEVMPGVLIERPTRDVFGYSTAKAPRPGPTGQNDEQPTQQEESHDHDRT